MDTRFVGKDYFFTIFVFIFLSFLVSCSSNGNGDSTQEDTDTPTTSAGIVMSGVAAKGLIAGGTVEAYSITDGGQKGDLLASATTSSDGSYTLDIGDYSGPVLVEVTGGTYLDEATGNTMELYGTMRAALPSVSGDVDVAITPLTEIAVRMAESGGGLDSVKIEDANELLSQLVGADITLTMPADCSDAGAFGSASDDEKNYALFLAAISQMSETLGQNVTDVIKAIEDDMCDLELDQTCSCLLDSIEEFLASAENNTGTDEATELVETIETIVENGLEPTGDLADLKINFAGFLNEPTEANYTSLMNYMSVFVAESKEAYLFKAMATLMDIYQNDVAGFLTDSGLDLDDLKSGAFDVLAFRETALRIATLDADIAAFFVELESRLGDVYDDLVNAEGVNTFISLTGFDTVYIDDVDVKILKAYTREAQCLCILLQAIDLGVDNWMVTSGEESVDLRDMIGEGEEVTDEQMEEFLVNNTDFLEYIEGTTKLDSFITAFAQIQGDYSAAVSALDALGSDGREMRIKNAFNFDCEVDFIMEKAVSEKMIPSILNAMASPNASIVLYDEGDRTGASFVLKEDGYFYFSNLRDIWLITFSPTDEDVITIYDFVNGNKSIRDLLFLPEDYDLYVETGEEVYMEDVEYIDWDDPIKAFKAPTAAIAIDGDASDWDSVPVLGAGDGFACKVAAGEDNTFYVYASFPSDFDFDEDNVRTAIEVPWIWTVVDFPSPIEPPEGSVYKYTFYIGVDKENFNDANENGVYDEGEVFRDMNGNGVYDGDEVVLGANESIFLEVGGFPPPPPSSETSVEEADKAFIYDDGRIAGVEVKFSHFDDWLTADNYLNQLILTRASGDPPIEIETVIDQRLKIY